MRSTASPLTGLVGNATDRGTYIGGANITSPAGTWSTYAILPQLPHSSSVAETHDSFSKAVSPASTARSWPTGSSSQNTHRRHLLGRASRVSRGMVPGRLAPRSPPRCAQQAGQPPAEDPEQHPQPEGERASP